MFGFNKRKDCVVVEMYNKIEKLCTENSTNVTAMCKALNITRAVLSELKSGRTKSLSADKVIKIAEYFNVPPSYLTGDTDSKENIFHEKTIPSGTFFPFTDSEVKLVEAYRNHPELQAAVNKLLEIDTSSEQPALSVRVAAKSGSDYNVHGTDEDTDPVVR